MNDIEKTDPSTMEYHEALKQMAGMTNRELVMVMRNLTEEAMMTPQAAVVYDLMIQRRLTVPDTNCPEFRCNHWRE